MRKSKSVKMNFFRNFPFKNLSKNEKNLFLEQ